MMMLSCSAAMCRTPPATAAAAAATHLGCLKLNAQLQLCLCVEHSSQLRQQAGLLLLAAAAATAEQQQQQQQGSSGAAAAQQQYKCPQVSRWMSKLNCKAGLLAYKMKPGVAMHW
jgi:hypothetical protein